MRIPLFIVTTTLFFACSAPEVSTPPTEDSVVKTDRLPIPEKKPVYSPDLKRAVLFALQKGYTLLDTDTFTLIPEQEHFSLVRPADYFDSQQQLFLRQSSSARVRLKKNAMIILEERTFLSYGDLGAVQGAMSRKLEDPRQERFLRRPFTFWQYKTALCHIFTESENNRSDMDELYTEWIRLQTPAE
ncbi:MAG: hypothetical protein IT233_13730 [Bacteroidia bacterium]|nr:hypothetical protein [Bacteroidia bacterium]